MGENYALAGFQSVEVMVATMIQSEDAQLAAVGTFLVDSNLNLSLQAHDWTSFARGYNGPNYAINRYDVRLNGEFLKYAAGGLPDLNVRMAQLYLTYLGFHPGPVDGVAGKETLAAFGDFAKSQEVTYNGVIDSDAVASLVAALSTPS
jgi:peptidoglycan hydrolase-like protein with peptidoglycan-binding domain